MGVIKNICVSIILGVAVYCVFYRFQHPDLTETRLFKKLWLGISLALVAAIIFINLCRRKNPSLIKSIYQHSLNNNQILNQMALSQSELAQALTDVKTNIEKNSNETKAKLQELENAINNQGNVSSEVEEALNSLKSTVQAQDALIEDLPNATDVTNG